MKLQNLIVGKKYRGEKIINVSDDSMTTLSKKVSRVRGRLQEKVYSFQSKVNDIYPQLKSINYIDANIFEIFKWFKARKLLK